MLALPSSVMSLRTSSIIPHAGVEIEWNSQSLAVWSASLALSKRADLINGISGIRKSLSPGADIFPMASLEMDQAHSRHLCCGMQSTGYDGHDNETALPYLKHLVGDTSHCPWEHWCSYRGHFILEVEYFSSLPFSSDTVFIWFLVQMSFVL